MAATPRRRPTSRRSPPGLRTRACGLLWFLCWFDQIGSVSWCEEEGHAGYIRRRTARHWANPVKSRRDVAHLSAGRRCERLEVAHTTAPFAPSQQTNGPRQRNNHKCPQALEPGGSTTTINDCIRAWMDSLRGSSQLGPGRTITRTDSPYERGQSGQQVKLDPDVAEHLKENKPAPGVRWHQQLTENYGVRQIVSRCYEVIGMAKMCRDMREFRNIARRAPRSKLSIAVMPLRRRELSWPIVRPSRIVMKACHHSPGLNV